MPILASDLTFGVEVETTISQQWGGIIGQYRHPHYVAQLPMCSPRGLLHGSSEPIPGWAAKTDASISCHRSSTAGVEFVTPILKGPAGLDFVLRSLPEMRIRLQAESNPSCGIHVHVGAPPDLTPAQLTRIVTLFANLEDAFLCSTGDRNRIDNRYCAPIKETLRGLPIGETLSYNKAKAKGQRTPPTDHTLRLDTAVQRVRQKYSSLNLARLVSATGDVSDLEFRCFPSTLNPVRVAAYIQMCLAVVEIGLSTRRMPPWDGPRSAQRPAPLFSQRGVRAPVGYCQSEISRMLQIFQWSSNSRRRYGLLDHASVYPLPDMPILCDTLKRLATSFEKCVESSYKMPPEFSF